MSGTGETRGRERRRHVRLHISICASLEAPPRAPLACEIFNMSVCGALLVCDQRVRLGQSVVLHVEDFGPINAHVARVTSTVIALAFEPCGDSALGDFLRRHAVEGPGAAVETADFPA